MELLVLSLISKEIIGLVAVAVGVGFPIAYLLLQNWLDQFAYRIDLSWETFLSTGVFVALITLLAVGYQILRTCFTNPVNVLRSE